MLNDDVPAPPSASPPSRDISRVARRFPTRRRPLALVRSVLARCLPRPRARCDRASSGAAPICCRRRQGMIDSSRRFRRNSSARVPIAARPVERLRHPIRSANDGSTPSNFAREPPGGISKRTRAAPSRALVSSARAARTVVARPSRFHEPRRSTRAAPPRPPGSRARARRRRRRRRREERARASRAAPRSSRRRRGEMSHAAIGAGVLRAPRACRRRSERSKSTRASRAKSSSKTAIVAPTRAAIAEPETTRPPSPRARAVRKRVVVLGSGMGRESRSSSPSARPRRTTSSSCRRANYFLYTPLLPGAATGAVEERSIVEPIRRPIAEKGYKYFEAACVWASTRRRKTITCRAADATFDATVPFSDLATRTEANRDGAARGTRSTWSTTTSSPAVGAVPETTFGCEGRRGELPSLLQRDRGRVEVPQGSQRAVRARDAAGTCRRRGSREILTFVVIGAGPTGVELAARAVRHGARPTDFCSSLRGFSFFPFPLSLFSLPFPSSRPGPTPDRAF